MHLDNWLFFVFAGLALLFRLLAGASSKANKDADETERRSTSTPPAMPRPTRTDSQEEQIRKFLEALGRPTSSTPPKAVRPRSDVAPRPVAPVQPPKIFPTPSREIARAQKIEVTPPSEPVASEVYVAPAKPLPPVPAHAAEVVRATDKIEPPPQSYGGTSIVSLLRSPSGLRDAIVLREIFGPPRGMKMSILPESLEV